MNQLSFLAMGEFSIIHWLIVGMIAVLLFGHRLPTVARSMGKSFAEFKKGLHNISDEMDMTDTSRRIPSSRPEPRQDREEVSAPKFEPPPSEPRDEKVNT